MYFYSKDIDDYTIIVEHIELKREVGKREKESRILIKIHFQVVRY